MSGSGDLKFVLGIFRFFEFCFAVGLTGVLAWFHERAADVQYYRLYKIDVPLGFSVAAIFISAMAALTYISHSAGAQVIMGIFDWVLFGGYIASSVVYSNFSTKCNNNTLLRIIEDVGRSSCATIRLVAAFLILQILTFLGSAILSFWLASRLHTARVGPIAHEKKRWYTLTKHSKDDENPIHENPVQAEGRS